MVILNLEVICRFRTFKQFVLYLLDNDILAIEHNKDISCTEINSTCPTILGNIERMHRCAGDLLTVHLYMNPFLGLIPEGLNNFLECGLAGFFIGCPYVITGLNILYRHKTGIGCNQRTLNEALNNAELLPYELSSTGHNAAGDADDQRIGYRRIPAVGNLLGCRICCGTDRALYQSHKCRCHTRACCRDSPTDRSACRRNSNGFPVNVLAVECLRDDA